MRPGPYLKWVCDETRTSWWHDSADSEELAVGLARGASGVTTNPVLISAALQKGSHPWKTDVAAVLADRLEPERKAESLIRVAVLDAASRLAPRFSASGGR